MNLIPLKASYSLGANLLYYIYNLKLIPSQAPCSSSIKCQLRSCTVKSSLFKKLLADICPFWGTLVPLFWISGDVSSGLQSQSAFSLIHFFAEVKVMYIPQDPPLVLHVLTSWQPACSRSLPHMHVMRWDLAQIRTGNHPHRSQTRYHYASDPA